MVKKLKQKLINKIIKIEMDLFVQSASCYTDKADKIQKCLENGLTVEASWHDLFCLFMCDMKRVKANKLIRKSCVWLERVNDQERFEKLQFDIDNAVFEELSD